MPAIASSGGSNVFIVTMPGASADSIVGARQAPRGDLDFGQLGHRPKSRLPAMRISVAADERTGVADAVAEELRRRGHEALLHGALADGERDDWAWASRPPPAT